MTFISYAQNFEDVLLRRAFHDVDQGFYVDVGAWEPELDSVTKALYDAGWSGINVEPSPTFGRLAAARGRDINLPIAIGERAGRLPLRIYRVGDEVLGTSTLRPGAAPQVPGEVVEETAEVEVMTLAQLLDEHAPGRHIHFLKIDAEGEEGAIVRSTDWRRYRPELLLIEATQPQSQERTDAAWAPRLVEAGYHPVWFDGLNAWFLREESMARAAAFRVPPNVFDGFRLHDPEAGKVLAWGRSLDAALQRSCREHAETHEQLQATRQQNAELDGALQAVRQHHADLDGALQAARQHAISLERALEAATQQNAALQQSLAQAEDDLRRAVTARAAAAACAMAFEQEAAELKARLASLETATAVAAQAAAAVRAEAETLKLQRWRLANRLELDDGPRVLTALLPLARVLRRIAWRGRVPAPLVPPDIAHLVDGAEAPGARPPAPPAAGGSPGPEQPAAPALPTDGDPRLARSVEAALLTLALRSEARAGAPSP